MIGVTGRAQVLVTVTSVSKRYHAVQRPRSGLGLKSKVPSSKSQVPSLKSTVHGPRLAGGMISGEREGRGGFWSRLPEVTRDYPRLPGVSRGESKLRVAG